MLKVSYVEILKPVDFQPEFEPPIPLERVWLIYSLDDDAEYAAHEIAKLGYPEKCQEYRRARKAFSGLGARKGLLESFDNVDRLPSEYKRWAGSSWKDILGAGYQSKMYLLMEDLHTRLADDPGPYYLDRNSLIHTKDLEPPKATKARRTRKPRTPKSVELAQEPTLLIPEKLDQVTSEKPVDPLTSEAKVSALDALELIEGENQKKPTQDLETDTLDALLEPPSLPPLTNEPLARSGKKLKITLLSIAAVALLVFAAVAVFRPHPNVEEQPEDIIIRAFQESPAKAFEELKKHNITAFDFGISLSFNKKENAIYWFEKMKEIDPKNEANYLFGIASSHLHAAHIDEAKKSVILAKQLAEKSTDKVLYAKCNQLLANIYIIQGNAPLAYEHSHEALAFFRELKLYRASASCLFQLATFESMNDNLDKAEKLLLEFEEENKLSKNPTRGFSALYFGKGYLMMRKLKYTEALQLFNDSLKVGLKEDHNFRTLTYIYIGLCQALSGNIEGAMKQAKTNDELISKHQLDEYLSMYNNLIWLVAYKCTSHWDIDIERKIIKWAEENNTMVELSHLLNFVKNAECP